MYIACLIVRVVLVSIQVFASRMAYISPSIVALISPEDLYKASCQFSTLNMPIRLKRYESGLLVIQSLNLSDDRVAQRIFNHVKKYGPLTAIKISELENLALPVAVEQLNVSIILAPYISNGQHC
jgi:hypothetical protein